ncbi:hypothetical protein [Catenuloplanes atrovinosus]|uniref:Uncharacterized protein n=1 Tax=Catenuloplanes atrovinosus TaxID=137266 RepID=A0AAE3YL39_9ACTN|nr:hypothetical protein [Catenuloplanes atrovinosus]MDR7274420.1 hypothetical protein [Catenuloplanes atrovinosus]
MPVVGPDVFTTVPLIYDSDDRGFAGPADMDGPVVGTLRFRLRPGGELDLEFALEYGHPNIRYDVALTAGASHDLGSGWVQVGILTTGPDGRGSAAISVPPGVLRQPPFGPGSRTDHVDIIEFGKLFTAGAFAAGAVNYVVCPGDVRPRDAAIEHRGTGDPTITSREETDHASD